MLIRTAVSFVIYIGKNYHNAATSLYRLVSSVIHADLVDASTHMPATSQNQELFSTPWQSLPGRQATPTKALLETSQQGTSSARTYPLSELGLATRTGDVNNDGFNDVVLTTWENRLRIWFHNPTCHELQERRDIALGPYPTDLEIADLNGDTRNDIVVLHSGSTRGEHIPGTISILFQSAGGLATEPITYTVGFEPAPHCHRRCDRRWSA